MGCCCCKLSGGSSDKETEMQESSAGPTEEQKKSLVISRPMSAPTIRILDTESTQIGGYGLALAAVSIEQDAAYWEWHIQLPANVHVEDALFGVASKKTASFFKKQEETPEEESPCEANGTNYMRKVEIQNGDVVGVAVQQSDLPMVQLFLNGEALWDCAINRFKGVVYPSIYLPKATEDKLEASMILIESNFKQMSPGAKFGPIIVARSIV